MTENKKAEMYLLYLRELYVKHEDKLAKFDSDCFIEIAPDFSDYYDSQLPAVRLNPCAFQTTAEFRDFAMLITYGRYVITSTSGFPKGMLKFHNYIEKLRDFDDILGEAGAAKMLDSFATAFGVDFLTQENLGKRLIGTPIDSPELIVANYLDVSGQPISTFASKGLQRFFNDSENCEQFLHEMLEEEIILEVGGYYYIAG